jgi:DNA-binding response OmpR family regulator
MNVLVIDDNASWAELCAVLLRKVASKIRIAHTYTDALKTLALPNGYDVVMLDLDLPDSPPSFTVDRIDEIRGSGRKVVVMTGVDVTDDMRARMKAHGANDCIYKGSLRLADELRAACV